MEYVFKILAFENYEGSSFDLTLDLGFSQQSYKKCRLLEVDTPKLRDPRSDWRKAARLAKGFTTSYLADGIAAQRANKGQIVFISEEYSGQFGRVLGHIERTMDGITTRLGDLLVAERLGAYHDAQNKSQVESAHKSNIAFLIKQGRIKSVTESTDSDEGDEE